MTRLEKLEKLAAKHQNGKVTVVYADGDTKRLLLQDIIPELLEGGKMIVDVIGVDSPKNGRLLELVHGVLFEPPGEMRL